MNSVYCLVALRPIMKLLANRCEMLIASSISACKQRHLCLMLYHSDIGPEFT